MLAHLLAQGFGLEAASLEEVMLALDAGARPSDLIFDSPAKTRAEIAWCDAHCPGMLLNANSLTELRRYPEAPSFQVGLRINPEVVTGAPAAYDVSTGRSKFGVPASHPQSELVSASVAAGVTALHMHIGSQVPTCDAHIDGVGRLLSLASVIDRARAATGDPRRITTIDIGGGVRAEAPGVFDLMASYGERLASEREALFGYEVRTEFGQWIHTDAGWVATRVETVEDRAVPMAFVHLGADFFMRDVYRDSGVPAGVKYGFGVVKHDGRVLIAGAPAVETQTYDVVGPLCFAGDVLARDLTLPVLEEGDWLVIVGTGANTLGLWSSHCSRAVPMVVAMEGERADVWSLRRLPG